jgi:Uma2 family endonuclease
MSYEEYLEYASESRIVEWVDGEVIEYMPAGYPHQNIVRFLLTLLNSFVEFFQLGLVLPAPFETRLWPGGPSREPDLLFINHDNRDSLKSTHYEGAPDLVVEVVSPGSVAEDKVRKFTHYEQAGVREYWIIDPRLRQQQVDCYVLDEEGIFQPAPVDANGIYRSAVLPGFWFKVDWLWPEELPNPQLALAEIMLSIESLPPQARAAYQALYDLLKG